MNIKKEDILKTSEKLWLGILEIIYPKENKCISCRRDGGYFCLKCRNKIQRVRDDKSIIKSYGHYGGILKKLVLEFKYRSNFTAGVVLSEFLAVLAEEEIYKDSEIKDYIITYIPMSKASEKKRGFNQSRLMAENMARILNCSCMEILKKVKETKEQKKLGASERKENIKDVFKIKKNTEIKDKKIILIDDVVTTGATLYEAARVLKEGGAYEVKLFTAAKSHI